jgi:L-ascorbate metabolism protein UlaG (beta-lactamase superfamily)
MSKSAFCFLTALTLASCVSSHGKQLAGKPYHHTENGFRNPEGSPERKFSWHSLWFFPSRPFAQLLYGKPPKDHVLPQPQAVEAFHNTAAHNSITWIGHMTAVIRLDEQVIVIDPWFTKYATPVPPFGPHRKMPPGVPLQELPLIDTVVVSHNHYDHFDVPTLEALPNPEAITLIVPLEVGQYVKHIPFRKVIELDWYQSFTDQHIAYTALPVVHFSARSLTDTNETLWAGFSIHSTRSNKKLFFFEGDYGEIYKKISRQYGPFDIAMIAAGAYRPRSLMAGSHCSPDTCVQAGLDLRSKVLIPLHWGTTVLGSENIYKTGAFFREEALKQGIPDENIWVMKIGETRTF